jgi:hypothetical protein
MLFSSSGFMVLLIANFSLRDISDEVVCAVRMLWGTPESLERRPSLSRPKVFESLNS